MTQDSLIIALIGITFALAIVFGIHQWLKMKKKGTEFPHVGVDRRNTETAPLHASVRGSSTLSSPKENA